MSSGDVVQISKHFALLDLEKTFDRVPRDVIWYALRRYSVPEEFIEFQPLSDPPGSALSPMLFMVVMDAITRGLQRAAPWMPLYTGDVMLACEDKAELEQQAQAWCDRLAVFGLKLNVKKTEYLTTDVNEHESIKINGTELLRVTSFKYLGSTVTSDGSIKLEVKARSNRPPSSEYGAECWPVTKEIESRLSVMETKMLRWTAGVTRLDRVCNETIRQRFGVAPVADKLGEARLRWYRHVLLPNDDIVFKIGLNLEVPGKRPRGRPKQVG
ncbi:unnamed protein product [Heligmosomoides polygyrus]|uniref:Reverse transcriptase domain-containing protein n=1 Tax=Heligmosomoides polygyrus TaxID=6339 RepID=A0A183G2E4_HELPZ|nr:unnamed protein product [Heligmosomoides polygyrus]